MKEKNKYMEKNKVQRFTTEYINNKLSENENYVRCTFYEIRVKANLSKEETLEFIKLSKISLENKNFKVYLTGSQYQYNNNKYIVETNELFIAIKK